MAGFLYHVCDIRDVRDVRDVRDTLFSNVKK
jgi:hypothetical protein